VLAIAASAVEQAKVTTTTTSIVEPVAPATSTSSGYYAQATQGFKDLNTLSKVAVTGAVTGAGLGSVVLANKIRNERETAKAEKLRGQFLDHPITEDFYTDKLTEDQLTAYMEEKRGQFLDHPITEDAYTDKLTEDQLTVYMEEKRGQFLDHPITEDAYTDKLTEDQLTVYYTDKYESNGKVELVKEPSEEVSYLINELKELKRKAKSDKRVKDKRTSSKKEQAIRTRLQILLKNMKSKL
jgi:hypothetical protein